LSRVVGPGESSLDWEEPCLAKRLDDLALCFIRDDVSKKIYMSWSPDLVRWSKPEYVFDGWAMPWIGDQHPDGDLLCITRHPTNSRAVWSFSNKMGQPGSWTAVDYVSAQTGSMMYGATAYVPGRGWVGVYAVAGVKDSAEEYAGPSELWEVTFT